MRKMVIVTGMLFFAGMLLNDYAGAMMCAGGHNHEDSSSGSAGHNHEANSENKPVEKTDKKFTVKESFYSTVYTCPMHPEVQSEKPGKCPKCGMKLEKKQILMTYACPEKDCEYQKAQPGVCPEHKKELIKTEVKYHCPKCGQPVNPEDLILKPVKAKFPFPLNP